MTNDQLSMCAECLRECIETLTELAPMQRELGLLRRAWEQDSEAARPLLTFCARAMSDRVLTLVRLGQG